MKIDWRASGIDVQKLINPNLFNVFESSKEKGVLYFHIKGLLPYGHNRLFTRMERKQKC